MTRWSCILVGVCFAINPLLGFFVLLFEITRIADNVREREDEW